MTHPIERMAAEAKAASRLTAVMTTDAKRAILTDVAAAVDAARASVLEANALDVTAAEADGLAESKLRRLRLTGETIDRLCDGVRQVAALPDPVGAETRSATVPSGLRVRKVRAPLGVIAMIYEARPAVTIDAFALCLMSGNACVLKGGKEATRSNLRLAEIARGVLRDHGAPEAAVNAFTSSDREDLKLLLRQSASIDLVIPRGGEPLIRFVAENSLIPTIQHYKGVCHVFVDHPCDIDKAAGIVFTAKTGAPSACNAVECALVHRDALSEFAAALVRRSAGAVTFRCDAEALAAFRDAGAEDTAEPAGDSDWGMEYLDTTLAVRTVGDIAEALAHIAAHSSDHTEAIVTDAAANSERFAREVHSSCVMVNASPRFNDGYELGLGAEIGISTSRIHAYGPMGLEELTTQRWIVTGDGQTR